MQGFWFVGLKKEWTCIAPLSTLWSVGCCHPVTSCRWRPRRDARWRGTSPRLRARSQRRLDGWRSPRTSSLIRKGGNELCALPRPKKLLNRFGYSSMMLYQELLKMSPSPPKSYSSPIGWTHKELKNHLQQIEVYLLQLWYSIYAMLYWNERLCQEPWKVATCQKEWLRRSTQSIWNDMKMSSKCLKWSQSIWNDLKMSSKCLKWSQSIWNDLKLNSLKPVAVKPSLCTTSGPLASMQNPSSNASSSCSGSAATASRSAPNVKTPSKGKIFFTCASCRLGARGRFETWHQSSTVIVAKIIKNNNFKNILGG